MMRLLVCGMVGIALVGCTPVSNQAPVRSAAAAQACPQNPDRQTLAGAWLYEEQGHMYTLRLDVRGDGAYAWKNGRFFTSCLEQGVWTGHWVQADNDREGGFRILLSRDNNAGDGTWWYTRIGEDLDPPQRGDRFQLKRIGTVSELHRAQP